MRALRVCLDFLCRHCDGTVGVTLHCEGAGLLTENPATSARVPCPNCGAINTIIFTTDGTLRDVLAERPRYRLPESCAN